MAIGKIYLLVGFILAGSSAVSAAFAGVALSPFTITFFSMIFALALPVACKGKEMANVLFRMEKSILLLLVLQALFGSVLFRVFLAASLNWIPAGEAGVLAGIAPVFTACFAWVLLGEQGKKTTFAAMLMTTAGIWILQGADFGVFLTSGAVMAGYALALLAAASEGLFNILSKMVQGGTRQQQRKQQEALKQQLHPLIHSGIVSTFSLLLCLPFAIWEGQLAFVFSGGLSTSVVLALLWYGMVVTTGAYTFVFKAAKTCDGFTIAAFSGVMPVSAMVLSVLVLGEQMQLYQFTDCGLIIAAVVLMAIPNKAKMEERSKVT